MEARHLVRVRFRVRDRVTVMARARARVRMRVRVRVRLRLRVRVRWERGACIHVQRSIARRVGLPDSRPSSTSGTSGAPD